MRTHPATLSANGLAIVTIGGNLVRSVSSGSSALERRSIFFEPSHSRRDPGSRVLVYRRYNCSDEFLSHCLRSSP
jgi:hypothetical protein